MAIPNQPDSNTFPLQAAKPGDSQLAIQRKEELVGYMKSFYRASWDWRSTRYHASWDKFDRNYHSLYDPGLLGRKEPWQSHMFVGVAIQNVEIIANSIYKIMMAPTPPVEVEAGPDGDDLQAELIQDAGAYEMRKAKFDLAFYDSMKEACRYGSGFMKLRWEKKVDTRKRRTPVMQSPQSFVQGLAPQQVSGQMPLPPQQVQGYQMQNQPVLIKNCLHAEYVHIRNVFPEPNTVTWDKVIHREKKSYGWIMKGIQDGKFFDVSQDLYGVTEGERFDDDLRTSKADRKFIDLDRIWSLYEKKHTIWELEAPIPRKWIEFDIPDGPQAEELVPGRVMVASGAWLLASMENDNVEGYNSILKVDYIRTGEPYGKGVLELILDEQDEINEIRNQRVDNVNLIMNKMVAVFDKAIVNRKDFTSQPGGLIRLKDQVSTNIKDVIVPMEFPDVSQSAYRETMEIERQIRDRTGANLVATGSAVGPKDSNQTLGGMELMKQTFNERLGTYGMIIESQFLIEAAERIYALIYGNLQPQDMQSILGTDPIQIDINPLTGQPITIPRYLAFTFIPPEMVSESYKFKPMGIFSMENKIVKSAQIMDAIKVGTTLPPGQMNIATALQYVLEKLQGVPEAKDWFPPWPNIPGLPGGPMMPPIMPGMGGPPPPGAMPNGPPPGPQGPGAGPMPQNHAISANPNAATIHAPGMKGGPHGNQPSFLPKPIRRQPVVG